MYFYLLNFHVVFFFISFISLLRLLIFSFISSTFIIVPWRIFFMAASSLLADNSNAPAISSVVSMPYRVFMRVAIFLVGLMNELHLKWRHFKMLVCEALNLTEPFRFSWPTLTAFQQGKGAGASSLMVIRVLGSMSPPWRPRGRVSSWLCTRPPLTPSLGGEGRACVALVGVGADVWSPHRIPTDNRGRGSCYCP